MPFNVDVSNRQEHNTRLMLQVRDTAISALVQGFSATLGHFDETLFERVERAGASQGDFFDGVRELRRRHEEVVDRFRLHLQRCWTSLEERTPLSVESVLIGAATTGLSLVSDQELESRLTARHLASLISHEETLALVRLGRILGELAGEVVLDEKTNPLGPEHIGLAVHEALSSSDLTLEVRLIVIKLCVLELAPLIGRLYQTVDTQLKQFDAFTQQIFATPPQQVGRKDFTVSDAEDPAKRAWTMRLVWRAGNIRREFNGAKPSYRDIDDNPDAQDFLLDALHQLLQETRQWRKAQTLLDPQGHEAETGSDHSASSAGDSPERPLSQHEMLSVLSNLQASLSTTLPVTVNDVEPSLSRRLKSEILSGASQLGIDPERVRLLPTDEDAIDLVGMLFDVMLNEGDWEGRPRDLIGRLVVPFVKVALLDRKLFVQKTHPARRFLSALAEACEGNIGESATERALMAKVEEVIVRLVAEFNENLAVFLTLEEEFREFLTQQKRRIEVTEQRATEIQRGQERLDAARVRANAELDQRLDGQHVPQAVTDFLRQPWAHYVVMTLLRENDDEAAFHDALQLADDLLGEVAQAQAQAQRSEVPWLEALRAKLIQIFASVGVVGEQADTAIGTLSGTLQAVAISRPDLERAIPQIPEANLPRLMEPETVLSMVADGTDMLDFDAADAAYFHDLPIGTWMDFVDKNGRVQVCKLTWVSQMSSRLLFVNRRGVRFCVSTAEELAVMVRVGCLRTHHQQDVFDAAMQQVIIRLDNGV